MAYVTYELKGSIALLTLTRPEKRNALCDQLISELAQAVERAGREARAAVLAGKGEHFSAGLDLAEHSSKSAFEAIEGSRTWHEVFTRIQRGRIPYFSALHGGVIGGGFELAAATHVRVAGRSAFFALPEGQRGIFVGGSGSVNISRLLGVARMTELMLTGRVLTADEAERFGVVSFVCEDSDAVDKAMELASQAAENPPLSNYAIINTLPRIHNSGYDEGLYFESMIAALMQTTPDAEARLAAFIEKRSKRVAPPRGERN